MNADKMNADNYINADKILFKFHTSLVPWFHLSVAEVLLLIAQPEKTRFTKLKISFSLSLPRTIERRAGPQGQDPREAPRCRKIF